MAETPPPASPPDGDPSMEDILASIRRILNEDEAPAAEAAHEPPAEDDVLLLDPSMMVPTHEPAQQHEAEPAIAQAEAHPADPEPEPEPHAAEPDPPAKAEPAPQQMEAPTPPDHVDAQDLTPELLAPEAAAAAASSVGSLVRTLAAGRGTHVYAGGPTLEDLVRAELRPLLKEWLDANLPPIVERFVRAEIERVVGRAVP